MLLAKLVTIHSSWHMSPAIIITKAVVLILEVIKCVRRDTFFEGSGSCRLAINHPLVCLEKTSHHEWLNTFLNLRKIDLRLVPAALCGCSLVYVCLYFIVWSGLEQYETIKYYHTALKWILKHWVYMMFFCKMKEYQIKIQRK